MPTNPLAYLSSWTHLVSELVFLLMLNLSLSNLVRQRNQRVDKTQPIGCQAAVSCWVEFHWPNRSDHIHTKAGLV